LVRLWPDIGDDPLFGALGKIGHDELMATPRTDPYSCSSFVVDLATNSDAMMMRVELPEALIDDVEYRAGGEKTSEARKSPGLAKYTNLILHRGANGSLDLYQWYKETRDGGNTDRPIRISLLDAGAEVMRWTFHNAFPVNYRFSPLDATSSDLLIETLELTFDSMDLE
jgi:phage tail-like protein